MADQFVLHHIRNLPLTARLTPAQQALLADAFEVVQLPAQSLVFQQGQPAQGLFLLVQGQADLIRNVNGQVQVLGPVNPNQYVGEEALFQSFKEHMSLRVLMASTFLFLPRLRFLETLISHPDIRDALLLDYPQLADYSPASFTHQRQDEKLLIRRQRHEWTYIRNSVPAVISGILLIVVALVVSNIPALTLFLLIAAVGITIAWIYYVYVEWRNDYLIVTDKRVIHREKSILSFEERINEIPISSVHEVNYVIPPGDFFARVFNYGTIFIKSAGESGNMSLKFIPNPREVQQLILTNQTNFRQTVEDRDREAIRAQIAEFLNPNAAAAQTVGAESESTDAEKPYHGPSGGFINTRFVDEQGQRVYRKHLSVWFTSIFLPLMGIIAALVIAFTSLFISSNSTLGLIGLLPAAILMIISVIWIYWADWDWRNDMMVIGRSTIRLIHRRPLWLQDTNEQFLISRIDSVSSTRDGVFNTMFDRGNVKISLVGDNVPKVFSAVGQPYTVQDEIAERRAAVLADQEEDERQQYREDILSYLDVFHEQIKQEQQQAARPAVSTNYTPPAYNVGTTIPNEPIQPPLSTDRNDPRPPRIPRTKGDV